MIQTFIDDNNNLVTTYDIDGMLYENAIIKRAIMRLPLCMAKNWFNSPKYICKPPLLLIIPVAVISRFLIVFLFLVNQLFHCNIKRFAANFQYKLSFAA